MRFKNGERFTTKTRRKMKNNNLKIIIPRPEVTAALEKLKFQRFLTIRDIPPIETGFCKWCGKKCEGLRYSWCSNKCRIEFLIRYSGASVQWRIRQRDKGVCAVCGIDTEWLKNELHKIKCVNYSNGMTWPIWRNSLGVWNTHNHQLWEADHIIPVILGGGCCGLDNYRTLCLKCHKEETAALARQRSIERNEKKIINSGQKILFETVQSA